MFPSTSDLSPRAPAQLLSPPPSPRKRRRILRDSQNTDGEITLERYILASDPYRSTSLLDPPPYPLFITPSSELADVMRPFDTEIYQILHNHSFPPAFVEYDTFSKPGYPGWEQDSFLLRVVVEGSQHIQLRFGPVKDEIMQLLEEKGFMDIKVEIVNTDLYHVPSCFYLAKDDPLVLAFERVVGDIITLLNHEIPQRWQMICPFNIGNIQRLSQPAIAVLVQPLTEADWSRIRRSINSLIDTVLSNATFDVEFLPGHLSLLHPSDESRGISFINRITATPKMGDSVGISDQNNAGTLGGWVELKHEGIVHRGFLTNYHVIRPSLSEKYPQAFLDDLDRYGVTFDRPLTQPIYLHSLPGMDRDATLEHITEALRLSRKRQASLSEMIQKQEIKGEVKPKLRHMLERNVLEIADYERQKDLVAKMPIVIGKVLVASGASIMGNALMDWAFVEITNELDANYFKPNETFEIPKGMQPVHYIDISRNELSPLPAGFGIDTFDILRAGEYCTKIGRRTEVTAGVCHGAKPVCNWIDMDRRFTHDGAEVSMCNNPSREYLIINRKLNAPDSGESCFAQSGDSGSFVLNQYGDVTGLLFGGIKRQWAHGGIATSMDNVIESMKLKLGASVSLSLPQ